MNSDKKSKHWNVMYTKPLSGIPWEIRETPKELVDLIESKKVRGEKALDVACGTGNYSYYLARSGFSDVLGVDFSENALKIAEEKNAKLKQPVRFKIADVTRLQDFIDDKDFDFILDYSTLHHIEPDDVEEYARQCIGVLKPGGRMFLVCYSEKDEFANGNKSASGKYGNKMFYRTAEEIRRLYSGLKEIEYRETALGKRLHHAAHSFLFEKPL